MELGSEYNLTLSELNVTENNLFRYLAEYNCIFTDSGRSALKLISAHVGEILLPEFICESVRNCFDMEKVVFYRIASDGQLDINDLKSKINNQTEAIYITHYFGALQCKESLREIREIANKKNILIIEDTTQSLFSASNTVGDYMIASVRKWMPIALGGVLYSRKALPDISKYKKSTDNDRLYGMLLKELFLNGDLDCNATYRNIFAISEHSLDKKEEIELLSDLCRFVISCVDIEVMKKKRINNYEYVVKKLDKIGINPMCKLSNGDCPFVLPLRIPNRNQFRRYLMDNKIYCAVHWPFDNFRPEERNSAIVNADTLISLPIDQRYGVDEMEYLIKVIKAYEGVVSF